MCFCMRLWYHDSLGASSGAVLLSDCASSDAMGESDPWGEANLGGVEKYVFGVVVADRASGDFTPVVNFDLVLVI